MSCHNIPVFLPHAGCPHRCLFCDQHSISGTVRTPSPEEVRAYLEECLAHYPHDPARTEIAFFGGSFTCMDLDYQRALLDIGGELVSQYGLQGIRLSTRPDGISPEIIRHLLEYPVQAVELGAQSMNHWVLEQNRRGHTAADTVRAAGLIRQTGLELGLQMMVGLLGDTAETVWETARALADLQPDTVRIYPMVILRDTPAFALWEKGKYPIFSLEEGIQLCAGLLAFFEERQIRVIKLGLHASKEVEGQYAAGLYHPAFRELCESRLYRQGMFSQISRWEEKRGTVYVHPKGLSACIGQKRENIIWLHQKGVRVRVKPKETVGRGWLLLCPEGCEKEEQGIAVKVTGTAGV